MTQEQLQSIIKLLDDPDESVYRALEKELLSQGAPVVKPLEDAWGQSHDPLVHKRIEQITHRIQISDCISDFTDWVASGSHDLAEASYIISRFQYPELDKTVFMGQLLQIAKDIEAEMTENLTPLEKIRVVNHVLYQVYRFNRAENTEKTHLTFYMNNVLSSKRGNLFTLCLLYATVAQHNQLPVKILSLPENLALAYLDTSAELEEDATVFFINPFSKGAVFGKNEIKDFLTRAKYQHRDEYFIPIQNRAFVILFLETLHMYYEQEKKNDSCSDLQKLIKIVKEGKQ